MKTYDIRDIYVCQIATITQRYESKTFREDEPYVFGGGRNILNNDTEWFYILDEDNARWGLFLKGIAKYKHILTGTKYQLANSFFSEVGEEVINPENVEELMQKEPSLCAYLIDKKKSFKISIRDVAAFEKFLNNSSNNLENGVGSEKEE